MKEFQFAKGVEVPNVDGIYECYEVIERAHPSERKKYYSFLVNASIEKLPLLIERFIEGLKEPCFFILEVPTNGNVENKLIKSDNTLIYEEKEEDGVRVITANKLHCDVYYMDGLSKDAIKDLFKTYQELLIHDGMSEFGFASHNSRGEIFVRKYKLTNIFTANSDRIKKLLQDFDIPEEAKIKTVWDNFSKETPGECKIIDINGKTVYDLIETQKAKGLYFAERREET